MLPNISGTQRVGPAGPAVIGDGYVRYNSPPGASDVCTPRAVQGPVKRGVTDTPRREGSGEARVSHHPLACARYFIHYTARERRH